MEASGHPRQYTSTINNLKKQFRILCRRQAAEGGRYIMSDEPVPEGRVIAGWRERHNILDSLVDSGERERPEVLPTDFPNRVLYRRVLGMELRARWLTRAGQAFRAEITSQLRVSTRKKSTGGSLRYTRLSTRLAGHNLDFKDFYYVHQTRQTHYRDLRGFVFSEANLSEADISLAHLEMARFQQCDMRGTLLAFSRLTGATFHRCNLAGAKLWSADLRGATLARCDVAEDGGVTSFLNVLYTRNRRYPKGIKRAMLALAQLWLLVFDCVLLFLARIFGGKNRRSVFTPRWRMETQCPSLGLRWRATLVYHTDAAALPTWEAPLFKRYISDEQYLDAVRKTHPTWHWVWGITSDCGRNWILWAFWSQMIALVFAVIYLLFPSMIEVSGPLPADNFLTYYYFSIVTFTTLGFGDISAGSSLGSIVVILQVIIGYVFFGGLVAMLADKLARRA